MTPINYNHLYYFYMVAKVGSIIKASEHLHLKPQTISGQITNLEDSIGTLLFERVGKRLILTDMGQSVYSYAEEIFSIGEELKSIIRQKGSAHKNTLSVGIAEVIPKVLAYQLLSPALNIDEPIRLVCTESDQETLHAELAINRLDLIITDLALPSGTHVKAYNHQLAESGFSFFAKKSFKNLAKDFPYSLQEAPLLMQGRKSSTRQRLTTWFDSHDISPNIVAEFDDTALLKAFANEGFGIFAVPTIIEQSICEQFNFCVLGRTTEIKERYYAISHERRIKHPAIIAITNAAAKVH